MRTGLLNVPRAALAAFLLFAASGWAQVPGEKIAGGIVVRIGIASSEQLSSHPPGHAEGKMHPSQSRPGRDCCRTSQEVLPVIRIVPVQVGVRVAAAGRCLTHLSGTCDKRHLPMPGEVVL